MGGDYNPYSGLLAEGGTSQDVGLRVEKCGVVSSQVVATSGVPARLHRDKGLGFRV